jgi:predicted nucleic acid-binding protein
MIAVFADTYYWLALINPRDQAHQEAVTLSQSLRRPLLTTAWVLTEIGDALRQPANRPVFLNLLKDIANDALTTVVPAEQKWFDRGVALYAARPDKKWPLTDCISFTVMQDFGLTEALTADSEFVQAGFRILMVRDE